MSGQIKSPARWPILMLIAIITVISGCASGTKMIGDSGSGLALQYRMPENRELKYFISSKSSQNLEVGGESIKMESDDTRHFSITAKERREDGFKIGLTIDSMNVKLNTPRGELAPDMSQIAGMGFEFNCSVLGKETDWPDGEAIEYELIPGRKQSVIPGFQAFFPDLPRRPIQVGDTWITNDTVMEKSNEGELQLVLTVENKLVGFQTIDGVKCAKITAIVTGTARGTGQEDGIDLVSSARISGKDVWYFALNEGVFMRMESKGIAQGTIVGSGTRDLNVPMKREYSMETSLVGRP